MTFTSDRVTRPDDVEARVFGACLVLLVIHAVDAALAHPAAGSGARVAFLLGAVVLAPFLWWDFVTHGRVVRTLLAGLLGLAALAVALAVDVPHVVLSGLTGEDFTGILLALGGLLLIALAFRLGLRGRALVFKLTVGLLAVFAILQWVVGPAINAGLATHGPGRTIAGVGTLGIPGAREVSFPARDGVRLSGWYVPGGNGAAVILLHGSHGSRMDTLAHLRLLTRAGYVVLAYDARGHGRSAGQTNALGWRGVDDVAGAVAFLRRRPGVDRNRIAALGLSMGAEEALRAAASRVPLRAVIADGAGASTLGDSRLSESGIGPVFESVTWLTMRGTELISGESEPAPLASTAQHVRVPTLLIASGRRGERKIDVVYRDRIGAGATLWFVPDAGHTRALQKHPQAYAARALAFLATALPAHRSTAVDQAR